MGDYCFPIAPTGQEPVTHLERHASHSGHLANEGAPKQVTAEIRLPVILPSPRVEVSVFPCLFASDDLVKLFAAQGGGFAALRFLRKAVEDSGSFSEGLIKRTHELTYAEAKDPKARGCYRAVEVEITGASFQPAPAVGSEGL